MSAGDGLPALTMADQNGVDKMNTALTVKEVAALRNCTEQAIRKQISGGVISARIDESCRYTRYLIPLEELSPEDRRRYMREHELLPDQPKPSAPPKPKRRFDEYTQKQRDDIAFWRKAVKEWREFRFGYPGSAADADHTFVTQLKAAHPEYRISRDILYRRKKSVDADDLDGLIEKRGEATRGTHKAPAEIFHIFAFYWLDERQPTVARCIEWTRLCLEQTEPELAQQIPSRKTFERYLEKEIEEGVKIMARYGDKAYNDRAMPFIVRDLEHMYCNDWWVADNHTLDIISLSEDGVQHRLSLTMYLDARSGMPTGWNFTDNPNGQSTILALRNGIMRCKAIPTNVYIDNGREFLIKDVGGLGHRQHKSTADKPTPPPVFERLGINMENALPRNAKAKVIERAFRDFTEWFAKLFPTYTGGGIDKRPECLKKILKSGKIPTDAEVREALNILIEGMWCHAPYGGSFPGDKGLTKIEVYNKHLQPKARMADEGELALMLMRSTQPQKVGRNGVYVNLRGHRMEYGFAELQDYLGKSVYIRYDPDNMETVRVYAAETDSYMMTAGMNTETRLRYGATKEEISAAMAATRSVKRATRKKLEEIIARTPPEKRIDALDLNLRKAQENIGSEGNRISTSDIIEVMLSGDTRQGADNFTGDVSIDYEKMNAMLEAALQEVN